MPHSLPTTCVCYFDPDLVTNWGGQVVAGGTDATMATLRGGGADGEGLGAPTGGKLGDLDGGSLDGRGATADGSATVLGL